MQKLKTKAVIFDRDGVIIDTEGVVIDSVRKAFMELGIKVDEKEFAKLVGRGPDIFKNYFQDDKNFNFDEFRKIQREIFYKNIDSAKYFEDALELVRSLYAKKITIAMTTSAGREGTLLILNKVGIDQMFRVIVTKEDCKNLKPHPEPYITTARKLEVEPQFCLVIEDTALGVEAAKKAGMNCIAVPNEYTKNQDFSNADVVVQSAKEIEYILEFV